MAEFKKGEFTELISHNQELSEATRRAIFELLKFAEDTAVNVRGGKDNKYFHYMVGTQKGTAMLFSCGSYGWVYLALGNFNRILKPADVSRFLRKLGKFGDPNDPYEKIHRFEKKRLTGGLQGFAIDKTLVNHIEMEKFKAAILWLKKKIEMA